MVHTEFTSRAKKILEKDDKVIGLAVGGSWLTNEIDKYSDLDLVIVTQSKISNNPNRMLEIAKTLGDFLSGFTGEHVGEPRVLICLYDNPLIHVDIKFLTLEELQPRVETPHLLMDKGGLIQEIFDKSTAKFPYPNYQWIEDRFWTWIHYVLLKIGRGEYLEAFDFFGFLRMVVFGPLLHIKNGNLPRAVRKVESELEANDLSRLKETIPTYNRQSLLESLKNSVFLYRDLRKVLFGKEIILRKITEEKVMAYFDEIQKNKP
ncbi:nucleotidyltransferase domain-containing protein [Flagellimonas sp.]|uniref:nucleotidyltransferase domain-containing protein n=1 Tax=Flagellimonas sp. TaxID=2058762 RepID=UPI003B502682